MILSVSLRRTCSRRACGRLWNQIKVKPSFYSRDEFHIIHINISLTRLVLLHADCYQFSFNLSQPNPVRQWATDTGVVESSATLSDRAAMYTWNCWIQWPWRCGKATRLSLVGAKSTTFSVYLRTAETAGVGRCGDDEPIGWCTTHSAADDWRGRYACER